jgi:lysophospholipase L1-like esterase
MNTFSASSLWAGDAPVRIMPLGDSITAGSTDGPEGNHPFEFGYRSGLYRRLKSARRNFLFVGDSPDPFHGKSDDPTHGGTVEPKLDLRAVGQGAHRGYGGWGTVQIQENVAAWIAADRPDIILLMIGINGIRAKSPELLDALVETIYAADQDVKLVVAQITPLKDFNQDLLDYNFYIDEALVPSYADAGRAITTVDQYRHFLTDPDDPKSIDATRLSNGINHPTNAIYDAMAESWFQAIAGE